MEEAIINGNRKSIIKWMREAGYSETEIDEIIQILALKKTPSEKTVPHLSGELIS